MIYVQLVNILDDVASLDFLQFALYYFLKFHIAEVISLS